MENVVYSKLEPISPEMLKNINFPTFVIKNADNESEILNVNTLLQEYFTDLEKRGELPSHKKKK